MSTEKLLLIRDAGGYALATDDNARIFSTLGQYFLLQANTVTTVTVPTPGDAEIMLAYFDYGVNTNVWVSNNQGSTLVFPTASVVETLAELRPVSRKVKAGDILQFLTDTDDTPVGIKYFSIDYGQP